MDELHVNETILGNYQKRKTNITMSWIDYRKAYDLILHTWIMEYMNSFDIALNTVRLFRKRMGKWRTEVEEF